MSVNCAIVIFFVWRLILCHRGFISAFGAFQTYFSDTLNRSLDDVSWIGSIQIFFLFFIGTFSGRLADAGYFRAVFTLGSLMTWGGIFATSCSTQYWQFLLAQGVCMGIGNGCLFCPSLAVVSTYFHKRRAIALGITASGSVTGGLVFLSMVRELLPRIGFAWTLRCIGLLQVVLLVGANVTLKPRIPPRRGGQIIDWPAFKELEYTFYACGAFCVRPSLLPLIKNQHLTRC